MGRGGWQEPTVREAVVLAAVERRLTNAEIADELVVSVRTVESHIAALRRKLEVDSRAGLVAAARTRRRSTVRVPQNSFVGREQDLQAVRARLAHCRWVTLVGAAGCGKTRLALEVAAADGRAPVVVELEHAEPDDVLGALAKAAGLVADPADLLPACTVALGAQPYLLVLDNADLVASTVVRVVGDLLTAVPSLTVLATCRAPIGGPDEDVHPLAPLTAGAAVRLFSDRAGPSVKAADHTLLERVCRRLDGLPLAVELAAARVRTLPLAELADRLDDGFGPLDRAGRGRHSTLEAAFAWTWDLLDEDEKDVLSRLAPLPRTFDLALAEAVTRPGAAGTVLRLLDRSLIAPTAPSAATSTFASTAAATATGPWPTRFRLLAALRAFVLDRTGADVVAQVREAHAAFHAAVVRQFGAHARTDDSRAAAAMAELLCPEVNAAVDWALDHGHPLALPLVTALANGGQQYGPDVDSLEAIARAARDQHVRAVASAQDLHDLGMALAYADLDLVDELAGLALERAADPRGRLAAASLAGWSAAYRRQSERALEQLDVAEALALELGDDWQRGGVLQARGIALAPADPEAALTAYARAMDAFAQAGDAMHVNNVRYMMASTAADAGTRTEQALAWVQECAQYAVDSGNRHELAHARLVGATLAPGDDQELYDAADVFRAVGDQRCLTRCLLRLAQGRPAGEQPALLEQALDVAVRARDRAHQATVLERLACARWAVGAPREAYLALGGLAALVGHEPAVARVPPQMQPDLPRWAAALAEGRAHAAAW